MLSSLPGYAVSQIKIDGVLQEFSSVPGVKEDVTEIVLNIKQLEIKNNSTTDEPKVAHIDVTGDCVVTAADIQVDSDIEILNPDIVISTLNGGADSKIRMELIITNSSTVLIPALFKQLYERTDNSNSSMFISNTLSISSSTGSAITSISFEVSDKSMNNFKCSQRTRMIAYQSVLLQLIQSTLQ